MNENEMKLLKYISIKEILLPSGDWNEYRAMYLEGLGLAERQSNFLVITPKGERYLSAGAFEKSVMENQIDG